MKDFTFSVPQNIIVGKGSLRRLPELSKEFKSYGFRVVCKEVPKEFIDKKSDNQEKENDENKPAVSPTPTQEGKDEKASKSKPIAICRHYSFHISKGDAMSPEARAAAFAVFYGMYNKKNYTEYYKNKPYGWKDTALLTTFVYSVIYIAWYLIVKFILIPEGKLLNRVQKVQLPHSQQVEKIVIRKN